MLSLSESDKRREKSARSEFTTHTNPGPKGLLQNLIEEEASPKSQHLPEIQERQERSKSAAFSLK